MIKQGRDENRIESHFDISNGFAERKCAIYEGLSRFNETVIRPNDCTIWMNIKSLSTYSLDPVGLFGLQVVVVENKAFSAGQFW